MKLADSEIRDIVKLLEAGKPLPDKYRFLLFEDKREVELVWNGKTGEVTNVVLPFQVIEQVDEPRAKKELKLQPDLFSLEDLDVPLKTARLKQWCEDINRTQSDVTYDFVFVDQESFEKYNPKSFTELAANFRQYKEN